MTCHPMVQRYFCSRQRPYRKIPVKKIHKITEIKGECDKNVHSSFFITIQTRTAIEEEENIENNISESDDKGNRK